MKFFTHLTLAFLTLLLTNCQPKPEYVKVDESQLDNKKLTFARNLAIKILTAQSESSFYILNESEATNSMINKYNEAVQKKTYEQIKNKYGDFKGVSFNSMMKAIDGEQNELYRFNGQFSTNIEIEVRVVLNPEGKLTGFWIKKWKDSL